MATKIITGAPMQFQYDNATEDASENTASGLCNAALHELFPRASFIITGQYRFRSGLIADYVVERVWPTGQRAIVLVVEVKPAGQSETQDAKADDQARQYGHNSLYENRAASQKKVYVCRWVGGEMMLYIVTSQNPQVLQPQVQDYMDLDRGYAAIRAAVAQVKSANLFQ